MRCEICDYARSQLSYEDRQRLTDRARFMLRRERVLDPHRFHEMVRGLPSDEDELRVAQFMLRPMAPERPDWHRPYATEPVVRSLLEHGKPIHALQFWAKGADPQTSHQWLWPVQGLCECWRMVRGTELQVHAVGEADKLWRHMKRHRDAFVCCLGKAGFPKNGVAAVVSLNHWEDPDSQHYRVASVIQRVEDTDLVVPAVFNQRGFMSAEAA